MSTWIKCSTHSSKILTILVLHFICYITKLNLFPFFSFCAIFATSYSSPNWIQWLCAVLRNPVTLNEPLNLCINLKVNGNVQIMPSVCVRHKYHVRMRCTDSNSFQILDHDDDNKFLSLSFFFTVLGLEQTRFLARKHCIEAIRLAQELTESPYQKGLIVVNDYVLNRMK